MTRKTRVAPESSDEIISGKGSNSLFAFEHSDHCSDIRGKVIQTNESSNNCRLNNDNKINKSVVKRHKRIARSVSEVVAEKEKHERNVFSRFANNYRRNGFYGIFIAVAQEMDLMKCRFRDCSKSFVNKVTCALPLDEEE